MAEPGVELLGSQVVAVAESVCPDPQAALAEHVVPDQLVVAGREVLAEVEGMSDGSQQPWYVRAVGDLFGAGPVAAVTKGVVQLLAQLAGRLGALGCADASSHNGRRSGAATCSRA